MTADPTAGSTTAGPVPAALPRGRLFVLSGPSGVGKSTVLARLREVAPRVWYSVSATTRSPRRGEIDGENYYFVSGDEFDELVAGDKMLEWAHFAGNRYGTPRAAVEKRIAAGRDVLLEIEVQGARQVRKALGDQARLIFLAPPSFDELARRLVGRGTEDEKTRTARLAAARAELAAEPEFDHTVVNTSVESAVAALVDLLVEPRQMLS